MKDLGKRRDMVAVVAVLAVMFLGSQFSTGGDPTGNALFVDVPEQSSFNMMKCIPENMDICKKRCWELHENDNTDTELVICLEGCDLVAREFCYSQEQGVKQIYRSKSPENFVFK